MYFRHAHIGCALMACFLMAQADLLAADNAGAPVKNTVDTRKADADAKKPRGESLKKAAAELTKEVREYAKNPKEAKLRSSSDFFGGSLPEDTTVDQLVAAIDSRQASEPVIDAYIRWQFMSALPMDLEPKQNARLLNAYRSAPVPFMRYGATPRDKQEFESMLKGATQNDEDAADAKLSELRRQIDTVNDIITRFRSALLARVPRGYDSFVLTLNEAQLRVDRGINVGALIRSLNESIHLWIVMDSPQPQQMYAVMEMLKKATGYKGVDLIRELKWDDKARAIKTTSYGETIASDKTFEATILELKEAIENPGANELKFKDDDKSANKKR